jgi:hypothetical protein
MQAAKHVDGGDMGICNCHRVDYQAAPTTSSKDRPDLVCH